MQDACDEHDKYAGVDVEAAPRLAAQDVPHRPHVENEEEFLEVKKRSPRLGDVKTFNNFVVPVPEIIDIEKYDTVLVWCERFGQLITSAKYR